MLDKTNKDFIFNICCFYTTSVALMLVSIPKFTAIQLERLKACKLPMLHFGQVRGDMIEMYKILSGKYDVDVTPKVLYRVYGSTTRGNMFKLDKGRAKYDLRKYYFTSRVVNAWNSLPDHVVLSETTINTFKS